MALKNQESVKEIIDIFVKGKLFEKGLKKKHFKIFVEILNNASRKKLKSCFSDKSRKGLKKYKKIVQKLNSKRIPTTKRMKNLRKTSESFRRMVRSVINDFMTNCCECDDNAL